MFRTQLLLFAMLGTTTLSAPAKFAAISLLDAPSADLRVRLGSPSKYPGNPLFVQDRPWETRIDNGYPNVVPPSDDNPSWQIWYGNLAFNGSRSRYNLLFANSTDGIKWDKPNLGIFDFAAAGFPNLAHLGTDNNIIVEGDGVGVLYDPRDPDPARRYKAIGDACWLSPTLAFNGGTCDNLYNNPPPAVPPYKRPRFYGYIASSPDGLVWPKSQVVNTSWPPPQKWDTHNNVFWDEVGQTYVATTRSVVAETDGMERETSITRSAGPRWEFDTSKQLPIILRGNISHQPYAQITFPWLNMYLGLVMVFDQDTGDEVHCRLTYAANPEGPWRPVEGDNIIDAPDFLPLGPETFDSHIIFAAKPIRRGTGADATELIYYMGGNGPHDGARDSALGLAMLRPDGFASVRGHGIFTSPSLNVTDALLTATVDFGAAGGALRIGVLPDSATDPPIELSMKYSVPLTANATDATMRWSSRQGSSPDLESLIGQTVKLQMSLEGDAMLYALGFAPRE